MHQEALTSEGRALFPLVGKFPEFYLAGGTALALQLGHRISVDFDLFSDKEITPTVLAKARNVFAAHTVIPSVNNRDELTVFVDSVKVTFLYYPFPLLQPAISLDAVRTASVQEIAAMKAYTIGRRTAFKDYVDLYEVIVSRHVSLSGIIKLALEKYRNEFNDRLFLEQLISLEDIDDEEIRFLRAPVGRKEVAQYFEQEIKAFKL